MVKTSMRTNGNRASPSRLTSSSSGRIDAAHKATNAWHQQAACQRGTMIFNGHSVTVAGCLLKVQLDSEAKVGRMTCERLPDAKPLTQIEVDAVMVDASLLAARVRRALGMTWRIEALSKADLEA
jgi:hypothetical protein